MIQMNRTYVVATPPRRSHLLDFSPFHLATISLMRGIVKVLPLPPAIRSILNIQNGTKATIQVVTNGDPDGGLYNIKPSFP